MFRNIFYTVVFVFCTYLHAEEDSLTSTESNLVIEAVENIIEELISSNMALFADSLLPQNDFMVKIPTEIADNTNITSDLYTEYIAFNTNAFYRLAEQLSLSENASMFSWSPSSVQLISVSNVNEKIVLETVIVVSNDANLVSFTIQNMNIIGTNLWIQKIE